MIKAGEGLGSAPARCGVSMRGLRWQSGVRRVGEEDWLVGPDGQRGSEEGAALS